MPLGKKFVRLGNIAPKKDIFCIMEKVRTSQLQEDTIYERKKGRRFF